MSKNDKHPWKDAKARRQQDEVSQRALRNELIEARVVTGMGRGIFALVPFRKDDVVCSYTGKVYPNMKAIIDELGPSVANYTIRQKSRSGSGILVPDIDSVGGHLSNHSCRPNCRFNRVNDGATLLRAERAIAVGEEVTTHYGWDGVKNVRCNCGEPHCYGYIGVRHEEDGSVTGVEFSRYLRAMALNRNGDSNFSRRVNESLDDGSLHIDTFHGWVLDACLTLDEVADRLWLLSMSGFPKDHARFVAGDIDRLRALVGNVGRLDLVTGPRPERSIELDHGA